MFCTFLLDHFYTTTMLDATNKIIKATGKAS